MSKKIPLLAFVLLTILFQMPFNALTYAQGQTQAQAPGQTQAQGGQPQANPNPSCALLNPQGKLGEWIVTIVEEQIATSNPEVKTPDTQIFECIRVNEVCPETAGTTQEQMCSTYKELSEVSTCPSGASCQRVQVFFNKSGTSLLYAYIGVIYRWAAGTIGIVCVIILVVSGLQITIAGDNSGKIDEAKERITQSLAGLALLFLSAVILYTINPNFFTF